MKKKNCKYIRTAILRIRTKNYEQKNYIYVKLLLLYFNLEAYLYYLNIIL